MEVYEHFWHIVISSFHMKHWSIFQFRPRVARTFLILMNYIPIKFNEFYPKQEPYLSFTKIDWKIHLYYVTKLDNDITIYAICTKVFSTRFLCLFCLKHSILVFLKMKYVIIRTKCFLCRKTCWIADKK